MEEGFGVAAGGAGCEAGVDESVGGVDRREVHAGAAGVTAFVKRIGLDVLSWVLSSVVTRFAACVASACGVGAGAGAYGGEGVDDAALREGADDATHGAGAGVNPFACEEDREFVFADPVDRGVVGAGGSGFLDVGGDEALLPGNAVGFGACGVGGEGVGTAVLEALPPAVVRAFADLYDGACVACRDVAGREFVDGVEEVHACLRDGMKVVGKGVSRCASEGDGERADNNVGFHLSLVGVGTPFSYIPSRPKSL